MANKQRGEVTLELAGKRYTLRPSFEAICELEDLLGMGIMEIVNIIHGGNVRLKFIAAVVWAGIWGYDKSKALSFNEVGELIMKVGIAEVITKSDDDGVIVANFLINGVTGDAGNKSEKGDSGNEKVAAGKKKRVIKKGSAST